MHWLIDESRLFIFNDAPEMKWRIAGVGGVFLPYKGREEWLKFQKTIRKGCQYNTEDEICCVLDVLIKCKVKGKIRVADIGHKEPSSGCSGASQNSHHSPFLVSNVV